MGEERERNGEIKQKIITSHGCSGILLVLLHPGLLRGGGLRVILLAVLLLYSSSSEYPQGGCRCSYNVGSHGCKYFFPFSQSAQWEFLSSVLSKSSPPLGQELEPS